MKISGKVPFTMTPEMKSLAETIAPWNAGEYRKASEIFDWMRKNIQYDPLGKTGPGAYIYKPAHEVFETRLGICEDQAYLYTALARHVGLETYVLEVTKDNKGEAHDHACTLVLIGGSPVHVDTAYGWFDSMHQETRPLSDEEVCECYHRQKHTYQTRESGTIEGIITEEMPVNDTLRTAFQSAQNQWKSPILRPERFYAGSTKCQKPARLKYFLLGVSLAGTAHSLVHYYSQLPKHRFNEKSLLLLMQHFLAFLN